MKNYYPELPEIPYKKTSVAMATAEGMIRSLIPVVGKEVVRMAWIMFANESAYGAKGVNNNYAGIQADAGRWSGLVNAIGTCVRDDSAPGYSPRRFICYADATGVKDTIDFLVFQIKKKGMYIGAPGVTDANTLGIAYLKKWVGRAKALKADSNFIALYKKASTKFM